MVTHTGEVELIVADSVDLMRPHLPGGSVDGLQVVHLQCHIGNDSISLARLGADVTGVDFSGEAAGRCTGRPTTRSSQPPPQNGHWPTTPNACR
ncbi:MAG: hypothetical protein LBR58_00535 [Propionibacteriaceae bacterium]|nr:hypothetical protein [Propionibacteriaceae bacterium]